MNKILKSVSLVALLLATPQILSAADMPTEASKVVTEVKADATKKVDEAINGVKADVEKAEADVKAEAKKVEDNATK